MFKMCPISISTFPILFQTEKTAESLANLSPEEAAKKAEKERIKEEKKSARKQAKEKAKLSVAAGDNSAETPKVETVSSPALQSVPPPKPSSPEPTGKPKKEKKVKPLQLTKNKQTKGDLSSADAGKKQTR